MNNYREMMLKKENKSLRTYYSKDILVNSKVFRKCQFLQPIHYFNDNTNEFDEIDNTIISDKKSNSKSYTNNKNELKVKIYDNPCLDNYIDIFIKGICFSFAPIFEGTSESKKVKIEIIQPPSFDDSCSIYCPKNLNSAFIYKNYYEDVDFKYELKSLTLEETMIIFNEKYLDKIRIKISSQFGYLKSDKDTICLLDTKENTIARVKDITVYDSQNRVIPDCYIQIESEHKNEIIYSIKINELFIIEHNLKFPIYIDPIIEPELEPILPTNFRYISNDNTLVDYVGKGNGSTIGRLYINPAIDVLDRIYKIKKSYIRISCSDAGSNFKWLTLHQLQYNHSSSNVNWNSDFYSFAIDLGKKDNNVINFCLNDYLDRLYNGGEYLDNPISYNSYGFIIKSATEGVNNSNIKLINNISLETDYELIDFIPAGTNWFGQELDNNSNLFLNKINGNVTYSYNCLQINSNRFPISISYYFSNYLVGHGFKPMNSNNCPIFYNDGWTNNYQQFLIPVYSNSYDIIPLYYKYCIGANVIYLYKKYSCIIDYLIYADDSGTYQLNIPFDEYANPPSIIDNIIMVDSQNNRYGFYKNRLEYIKRINNDIIMYDYESDDDTVLSEFYRLIKIRFGALSEYVSFSYNNNGLIQEISYIDRSIYFNYESGLLVEIENDIGTTAIEYVDNRLNYVLSYNTKKIEACYSTTDINFANKIKVYSTSSKISYSGTTQGTTLIDQYSFKKISRYLVKIINKKGVLLTEGYDFDGNTLYEFEDSIFNSETIIPLNNFDATLNSKSEMVNLNVTYTKPNLLNDNFDLTVNSFYGYNTSVGSIDISDLVVGKTYLLTALAKASSSNNTFYDDTDYSNTFKFYIEVHFSNGTTKPYEAFFDPGISSNQLTGLKFKFEANVTSINLWVSYRNNINTAHFYNFILREIKDDYDEIKFYISTNSTPENTYDILDINSISCCKIKYVDEDDNVPYHNIYKLISFKDIYRTLNEIKDNQITFYSGNCFYSIENIKDVKYLIQNNEISIKDIVIGSEKKKNNKIIREKIIKNNDSSLNKLCALIDDDDCIYFNNEIWEMSFEDWHGNSFTHETRYLNSYDVIKTIEFLRKGLGYVFVSEIIQEFGSLKKVFFDFGNYHLTWDCLFFEKPYKCKNATIIGNYQYNTTKNINHYNLILNEIDWQGNEIVYTYDNCFNLISKTLSNADSSKKMVQEYSYSTDKQVVEKEYHPLLPPIYREYCYNDYKEVCNEYDYLNHVTNYTLDISGTLSKISTSIYDSGITTINENNYSYQNNFLVRLSNNCVLYDFIYTNCSYISEIKIYGFTSIVYSETYLPSNLVIQTKKEKDPSGNDISKTEILKNKYGNTLAKAYCDNTIFSYQYDNPYSSGKVSSINDVVSSISQSIVYDNNDNIISKNYTGQESYNISIEYDLFNRISEMAISFSSNETYEYYYEYIVNRPDDLVEWISLNGAFSLQYEYDDFSRINQSKLYIGGSVHIDRDFTYRTDYTSVFTTFEVSSILYKINNNEYLQSYSYDLKGNVTGFSILDATINYYYDGLNRLKLETNPLLNKKYEYHYDSNGNITYKKIYNLTTNQLIENINYTYSTSTKDILISYGNDTIGQYSLQGRPLLYRGYSLTWDRGNITSFTKNNQTINCFYSANNLRLFKLVNTSIAHTYYWHDKKLIKEVVSGASNYELVFLYAKDEIIGFKYKTANSAPIFYYYMKNLFGDIVALLDDSGTILGIYIYNAWGEHIIASNNNIMSINPIRFRGYYYDNELNMYYLQSRYYDPVVCRFISSDNLSYLSANELNGFNLFTYCSNNPIRYIDFSGHSFFPILDILFSMFSAACLTSIISGLSFQFTCSTVCYLGFSIVSIFNKSIRSDMNKIKWNPFNSNELLVNDCNSVFFYKGVPAIFINWSRSLSFGMLFLNSKKIHDLRHEYGHTFQQLLLGPLNYLLFTGIPSYFQFGPEEYYKKPWEAMASILGGDTETKYSFDDYTKGVGHIVVAECLSFLLYFLLCI